MKINKNEHTVANIIEITDVINNTYWIFVGLEVTDTTFFPWRKVTIRFLPLDTLFVFPLILTV